jgi:hypothetical protein
MLILDIRTFDLKKTRAEMKKEKTLITFDHCELRNPTVNFGSQFVERSERPAFLFGVKKISNKDETFFNY